MGSSRLISRTAISLILICFFLPWVTVSCSGNAVLILSGYDLAAGKEISEYGERTEADVLVFIIPLAALVAAGFAFSAASPKQSGQSQIISGVVGFGVLALKWLVMQSNQTVFVTVSAGFGLLGTVGGLFLLLIGGWMTLSEHEEKTRKRLTTRSTYRRQELLSQSRASPQAEAKKCPYCAETIKKEAIVCRFCGRDVVITPETVDQIDESQPLPTSLVKDEEKVIELMAQGLDNLEIAERLNMTSKQAVGIQLGLKKRFGVSSNKEVIELAAKQYGFFTKGYTLEIRVCPECGKQNLEDNWSCVNCGETLAVNTKIKKDIEEVDPEIIQSFRTDLSSPESAEKKSTSISTRSGTKKCPYCAEEIKAEAIVCRYCNRELTDM